MPNVDKITLSDATSTATPTPTPTVDIKEGTRGGVIRGNTFKGIAHARKGLTNLSVTP